jgi:enediyne biosynthesis protein E4
MKFLFYFFLIFICGCASDPIEKAILFEDITQMTDVVFQNNLTFTEQLNPYTYKNYYNGGGVSIGDINNDGLLDIYFSGNQVENKLYLNLGNMKFKDISKSAGVTCPDVWSTGVTMVDINGDGFLDIYVCKSGNPDAPNRHNELFINNGDLTFTEKAKEFGLDIIGLSVQAAFFDYDKDGDLDCYLLTNSIRSVGNYDIIKNQRTIPDADGGGNRFLINDAGKFKDHSLESGIYRSSIGFGLGITLGDFNCDNWTDIFVSNDFFERDYLYINDKNGGFNELLPDFFSSISMGSMGADFADLNNDGNNELFVTEMLPDSLSRKKTKTIYESWDKYKLNVENGYHHQFSRNVLQTKINNTTYAEIGRMAGVAASEWSWGALLFDMDNDGLRDIFIANGIYKDLLDRDYLSYAGSEENIKKTIRDERAGILKLIDLMPSSLFPNYAFRNEGGFQFKNLALEWGLSNPMFSTGSAYGDLDNDGDLDLVLNNIGSLSKIYRNNSDSTKSHSITISLSMNSKNSFAIGAEVKAYCGEQIYSSDNFVTRGFQSSSQPQVTIGLGNINKLDSLIVKWPDNSFSIFYDIQTNKKLEIYREHTEVHAIKNPSIDSGKGLRLKLSSNSLFKHKGNEMSDFNRDRLLPMMYSNETPSMMKGDIDNDGIDEVYIGGGKDQSGVFLKFGINYIKTDSKDQFKAYKLSEETSGTLADLDNDGDLDIYLAMGGRFFPNTSVAMQDVILFNNGRGDFSLSPYPLPYKNFISTSVVKPIDFDKDGDIDLLVGERYHSFEYGIGGRGYLLENDGHGLFKDVTLTKAPMLFNSGMITDVEISDFDKDGWNDIIIVGDWMPIVVLRNNYGEFVSVSNELGLNKTEGWWHDIESADFNNDGIVDFVIGNQGHNSFFKSEDRMYVGDFDKNGSTEHIFCTRIINRYYPISDKDEFLSQLPSMKKSLVFYNDYAKKSMEDIFGESVNIDHKIFQINLLSSVLLLSDGSGYQIVELPKEAQYSTIHSLLISDFNNDGIYDLIAGGNQYQVKPQFGRYDASNCWFFKGVINDGRFSFESGQDLGIKGQIRDLEVIERNGIKYVLFAKYDDNLEIHEILN